MNIIVKSGSFTVNFKPHEVGNKSGTAYFGFGFNARPHVSVAISNLDDFTSGNAWIKIDKIYTGAFKWTVRANSGGSASVDKIGFHWIAVGPSDSIYTEPNYAFPDTGEKPEGPPQPDDGANVDA